MTGLGFVLGVGALLLAVLILCRSGAAGAASSSFDRGILLSLPLLRGLTGEGAFAEGRISKSEEDPIGG